MYKVFKEIRDRIAKISKKQKTYKMPRPSTK